MIKMAAIPHPLHLQPLDKPNLSTVDSVTPSGDSDGFQEHLDKAGAGIAQELCEQAAWKEVIARNRLNREEEYAKRRRQDAEEELQRQRVLAERERAEYLKRTEHRAARRLWRKCRLYFLQARHT